jgi:hypothetical protein
VETWIEIGLIWVAAFVAMGLLARHAWVRTIPGQKIADFTFKLRGLDAPMLPRAWTLSSAPALGAFLGIVGSVGSRAEGGNVAVNLVFAGMAVALQAWTALSVRNIADEFT